ncbi:MAG: ABC transporter ATP-binding protein [Chlamydiia bacterium]|nr:ABC transporter ATP-binding protein [Chlamydiia bacterium]
MNPAVVIDDLCFAYEEEEILHAINMTIAKGEAVGVIGPNGGGKTTLLKLILGLIRPTRGTIQVLTKPIAYVPQTLPFDREFPISLLEVVLMGRLGCLTAWGRYRNEDKEAAERALEQVGLANLGHRPFGKLSGGQMQRGLIARALVSEPKLLLLDEPTASVDPQAQEEIIALLNTLKKGMTLLLVTHDLKTAVEYVDRIISIHRTATTYSKEEICDHFAHGLYHPLKITEHSC